jgi:hypothetical protein
MQQDNNNSKVAKGIGLVVISLIVGALIAYPIGSAMGKSNSSTMTTSSSVSSTTTKAAGLRATLNNLLREHVTTNLTVTYNIIDKVSDTKLQASLDAQTANAVAIAGAVGSIYGDDAKAAITTPFVDHLTQSNNYAKAVLIGDKAGEETSLAALQMNLHQIADVFHSVIPSLPSDTLYGALNDHETLMNKVAVAYQSGDYTMAYQLEDQALTQISGGADALAGGIVMAKPDMFKQ